MLVKPSPGMDRAVLPPTDPRIGIGSLHICVRLGLGQCFHQQSDLAPLVTVIRIRLTRYRNVNEAEEDSFMINQNVFKYCTLVRYV